MTVSKPQLLSLMTASSLFRHINQTYTTPLSLREIRCILKVTPEVFILFHHGLYNDGLPPIEHSSLSVNSPHFEISTVETPAIQRRFCSSMN